MKKEEENKSMRGERPYTHTGILFSHKKEILPFATTWIELDGIQAENDKYYIISLTGGV